MFRVAVFVLSSSMFVGCLTVSPPKAIYTQGEAPPHEMKPRAPDSVRVFLEAPKDDNYIQVGTIEASINPYTNMAGFDEIRATVKKKAADVGCDAIIDRGASNMHAATCLVLK